MALFKKVVPAQGGDPIYRNETTGKVIEAKELEEKYPAVFEELQLADNGDSIDSESITKGEGDGVLDHEGNPVKDDKKDEPEVEEADEPEEEAETAAPEERVNPYTRPAPVTEPGFGFPRKKGKTVDIFDGKTPHTHIRVVAGMPVPLSEENYKTKTDAEIYERLEKLKLL